LLTLLVLLLTAGGAVAESQSPTDRVREAAEVLEKMLSDPAMQDPANHQQAIDNLREAADKYIDFKLVTMYAVGRPWLKMSPATQDELTETFIQLLERTYLKRIPAYEGQKIEFSGEQISGKKAKTTATFIDKDKKVVVEFRLRDMDGTWMIYDMVAEGVSLVSNYRSQFSQVLSDGTPEGLIKAIRDRIKALDENKGSQDEPAS